ncbi:MAG: hypothetical protein A3B65_01480 [Acidobacteria bacterium RIFCSPHIGHO2_02_FULL_67_57]|nr:MAG: hypothetical protein A3B65_01480 [Acidobacteria bacterium RIFCSPHIGHO2_02_FULL_67_57]OFV85488.1 MAG: hypothetical protein A2620_00495 [Acidobacteria bacterium RIFCSPHIGHO2_01_FULL_67_28]
MDEDIGAAAGRIWEALNSKGELTPAQLQKAAEVEEPLLSWAVGWLAREDKLVITRDKRGLRVSLK